MEKKTLTAFIIDDEQNSIDYLCGLLEEHHRIKIIGCYQDALQGIQAIKTEYPEILFLDVKMPLKTGFDIIKEVQSVEYKPIVIFTTGYEKFAIKAIKYAAFDYLLKPINQFELEQTIDNLLLNLQNSSQQGDYKKLFDKVKLSQPLKFNTSTGFVVIYPDEIIYLEAYRNYCEIYLTLERREVVTTNMNSVLKLLPSQYFFRISRFNAINTSLLTKVERAKKRCFLNVSGNEISLKISSKYFKELENLFSSN